MAEKKDFRREFDTLFIRAKALGLSQQELGRLRCVDRISSGRRWTSLLLIVLAVAVAIAALAVTRLGEIRMVRVAESMGYNDEEQCFLENYEFLSDMLRPVVDCTICQDIRIVDRVSNLSHSEFMAKYAFTGRPVVVTDGTKDWSASDHFNFQFFKKLYKRNSPNLSGEGGEECQFFPYRTDFETLGDVFQMPAEMRDGVSGKPWYIGW